MDSADGYEKAVNDATQVMVSSRCFVNVLANVASERRQVAENLKSEVRHLGEKPEEDGTIFAAAHRTWLVLRDVVTGGGNKAIVAEVECGEDHINISRRSFEDALKKMTI